MLSTMPLVRSLLVVEIFKPTIAPLENGSSVGVPEPTKCGRTNRSFGAADFPERMRS
jgi:hypothetical protein